VSQLPGQCEKPPGARPRRSPPKAWPGCGKGPHDTAVSRTPCGPSPQRDRVERSVKPQTTLTGEQVCIRNSGTPLTREERSPGNLDSVRVSLAWEFGLAPEAESAPVPSLPPAGVATAPLEGQHIALAPSVRLRPKPQQLSPTAPVECRPQLLRSLLEHRAPLPLRWQELWIPSLDLACFLATSLACLLSLPGRFLLLLFHAFLRFSYSLPAGTLVNANQARTHSARR
jgi:hypothetical protein